LEIKIIIPLAALGGKYNYWHEIEYSIPYTQLYYCLEQCFEKFQPKILWEYLPRDKMNYLIFTIQLATIEYEINQLVEMLRAKKFDYNLRILTRENDSTEFKMVYLNQRAIMEDLKLYFTKIKLKQIKNVFKKVNSKKLTEYYLEHFIKESSEASNRLNLELKNHEQSLAFNHCW